MPRSIFAVAFLVFSRVHAASASGGASISGRVEDPRHSPISGATVTIESLETGAVRALATNADGSFRAQPIPLGPQKIKIEKTGFKTVVRSGVQIRVGQDAVVNIALEVGELQQQVTVLEGASLVNTTTSPVSGLVDSREVKDLPLNGRSFDNLIALNPSAINYSAYHSANTSTSNGNTFSVSGRRTTDNLFLLNGVEYMGSSQLAVTPGGASQELLGIDAMREFNLLTDTYPAEYGKRAGGQILIVTQSGGNDLHGSVFEFLRNSALDARNFFDQGPVPPFRRNQFGGALGGPLKKNKLFLFGNYEGFRQSLAISSVSVVPDANARLGSLPNSATGVFSPVLNLNRSILPYLSLWPLANGPELYANGVPSGTALSYNNPKQSIHEDFGTARLDYNLRERDSLSAAYTIDDGYNLSPLADPLFGSALTLRNQVLSIQEVHTFSPRIVNTFTTGFSRAAYNFDPATFAAFPRAFPSLLVAGRAALWWAEVQPQQAWRPLRPQVLATRPELGTAATCLPSRTTCAWILESTRSARACGSSASGTTKFRIAPARRGNFHYAPDLPARNGKQLSSDSQSERTGLEEPLRSLVPGGCYQTAPQSDRPRRHPPRVLHWLERSFRSGRELSHRCNSVLIATPRAGNSVYTQNNAKLLFAPRVGLAWDPLGNGKMAIRAGYGTYYSLIDSLAYLLNSLPPLMARLRTRVSL